MFIRDEMHQYEPVLAAAFAAALAASRNASHAPVLVQSPISSAEDTVAICIVGQPGANQSYT